MLGGTKVVYISQSNNLFNCNIKLLNFINFSAVGDVVAEDEEICQIETDKTSIPVKAPFAGVITELFVEDGSTVKSGTNLFSMSASGLLERFTCLIFLSASM